MQNVPAACIKSWAVARASATNDGQNNIKEVQGILKKARYFEMVMLGGDGAGKFRHDLMIMEMGSN